MNHNAQDHTSDRRTDVTLSPTPLAPLSALYQAEVQRMARHWPEVDPARRAYWVAVALARAFLDVTRDELIQAIREGDTALGDVPDVDRAALRVHTVDRAITHVQERDIPGNDDA